MSRSIRYWSSAVTAFVITVVLMLWVNVSLANQNNKPLFPSPSKNLSADELINFAAGRSLFKKLWIASPATTKASDGLGPLYNARSCLQCHNNAGRGQVPEAGKRAVSLFMRLSIPPQNDEDKARLQTHQQNVIAEPTYGTQFQNFAVTGLAGEGELQLSYQDKNVELADGEVVTLHQPVYQLKGLNYGKLHPETMMSPRMAPALIGMGLLEQIPEKEIRKAHDPDDNDNNGISGKANQVWSIEHNKLMLGRFGYKAGVATLNEQNQRAFTGDIGLSTKLFPEPWGDCTKAQQRCQKAPHGDDASQGNLEIPAIASDMVLHYLRQLSIPEQRNADHSNVIKGKQLFHQLDCASCHRPSFTVKGKTISPYSDLLLHDMGDGLADHRPEGLANGKEWRTAPLWGIGLTEQINGHHFYLHDGRARTLQEAILWHGGEAQQAKNDYTLLAKHDRHALIAFLESL